jgi:hypothetical protein
VDPGGRKKEKLAMHKVIMLALLAFGLILSVVGCKKPAAPPVPPQAASASAPGFRPDLVAPVSNAELAAAQASATSILDGLLAGQYDTDAGLSPVARKVKGFTSWSVTAQKKEPGGAAGWHFTGTLNAPRPASFDLYLVKQEAGGWAVGSFSGPNPLSP